LLNVPLYFGRGGIINFWFWTAVYPILNRISAALQSVGLPQGIANNTQDMNLAAVSSVPRF